jgi:peptidoglycan/xylan/chitin deacetylase (PgdA/CDA1 family)
MWNDTVIEAVRSSTVDELDLGALGLGRFPLAEPAQRRRAIDAMLPVIKYRALVGRDEAISRVLQACGSVTLPEALMMKSSQVRDLQAAGMEIGGHTVHHPILTELADDDARHEIAAGREVLQRLLGAPVDVFAYPNGRPGRDYDARHVAMVRALGFRCAVSTAVGVVRGGADALQWPRFTPWDHSDAMWLGRLAVTRYRGGTALTV